MGSSGSKPTSPEVDRHATVALDVPPALEISKDGLDFNTKEVGCPLNVAVYDEVELNNPGQKKVKFKFDPIVPSMTCQLSFSPSSGTLDKGKRKRVKVKLVLIQKVNLNFKIPVRVQDGASVFLNLRVTGEAGGVFGADPTTLELVEDNGHNIPAILATMRQFVVDKNGLNIEGIFRLAGEQTEIQRLKSLMNKKQTFETKDVNAVASLIKIWFRDLPVPILNAIPQETIMNFSSVEDCVTAYHTLPEPQKSLLDWLLDFLVAVSQNSDVNKMTTQNLAIVVAPNLYDISTPNPMEGLVLSQKCAQFLNHVINSHISGQV
jgi:hypothetical protein